MLCARIRAQVSASRDPQETGSTNDETPPGRQPARLRAQVSATRGPQAPSPAAEKLVNKGFTVQQLLMFYQHYREAGKISRDTTTNEVVREIVIPETAGPPVTCYMDSDFMCSLGGGHKATRLVSHAWMSRFVNTVLNIVLDATQWTRDDIVGETELNGGTPFYGRRQDHVLEGAEDGTGGCFDGMLHTKRLLSVISAENLRKTYWLCIFAVDEHHAICGDCWSCNSNKEWKAAPVEHLRANPCLSCRKPKFNPCQCGTIKYRKGDPLYEIDLFPQVVRQMEALVVSLDPNMHTIERVWVVAEIGEAITFAPVFFRLALGLSEGPMQSLKDGRYLMDTVANCKSTSAEDKERILQEIKTTHGSYAVYDEFVNCMLELNFGRSTRLANISGAGAEAIQGLTHLEMNFNWDKSVNSLAPELGTVKDFGIFKSLRHLVVNVQECSLLTNIDGLGERLAVLQSVASIELNLLYCCELATVDGLGKCFAHLRTLSSLDLKLVDCVRLVEVDELAKGLSHLEALTSLTLSFGGYGSELASVDELGRSLAHLKVLTSLYLEFNGCEKIATVDELGKGLAHLAALTSFNFSFGANRCEIASVAELGKGLGHLGALTSLSLTFWNCPKLFSVEELGTGLAHLETLTSLRVWFQCCKQLASVDEWGKSLGHLSAVKDFNVEFRNCGMVPPSLQMPFESLDDMKRTWELDYDGRQERRHTDDSDTWTKDEFIASFGPDEGVTKWESAPQVPRCEKNHFMQNAKFVELIGCGWTCEHCEASFLKETITHGCRACFSHLCPSCERVVPLKDVLEAMHVATFETFESYVKGQCWNDPETVVAFSVLSSSVVGQGFCRKGPFVLRGECGDTGVMKLQVRSHVRYINEYNMDLSWQGQSLLAGTVARCRNGCQEVAFAPVALDSCEKCFRTWQAAKEEQKKHEEALQALQWELDSMDFFDYDTGHVRKTIRDNPEFTPEQHKAYIEDLLAKQEANSKAVDAMIQDLALMGFACKRVHVKMSICDNPGSTAEQHKAYIEHLQASRPIVGSKIVIVETKATMDRFHEYIGEQFTITKDDQDEGYYHVEGHDTWLEKVFLSEDDVRRVKEASMGEAPLP